MNFEIDNTLLLTSIKQLIEESKLEVALSVNAAMSRLYWQIGKHIKIAVLQNERAEYGKQIVVSVSRQLAIEYGASFSEKNLRRMVQFAEVFPKEEIVVPLIRKLSWSHILAILPIEDDLKREFYIQMCIHEKWSVRTFRDRINSMLYERTVISKTPEATIKSDLELLSEEHRLTSEMVFRDPYFLDFLGLKDVYSEKDLEASILAQLQNFILEFGSDFAFLSRQKRITIGDEDFYIDLLFYHRKLKRLIAIELKLGKFKHEYKSQLEVYLRWLDKYEKQEGENSPLGILLCAEKNDELIELLELNKSGIHVATYLTELPPIEWLKTKLQKSIQAAKNRSND